MRHVRSIAALTCSVTLLCAPARAEVIWDDLSDVNSHFHYTIKQLLPTSCFKDEQVVAVLHPIGLTLTKANEATFETRIDLDPPCLATLRAQLVKRVKAKKPIISNATAHRVDYYDTKGDGPTLMIRLDPDARMLREIKP